LVIIALKGLTEGGVVVVVVVVVVEDIEVDRVALLAPDSEPIVEDELPDPAADFVTLLEAEEGKVVELFEAKAVEDAAFFKVEMVEFLKDNVDVNKFPEGEFDEEGEIPDERLAEESTKFVDERVTPALFIEVPESTG